MSIDKNEGYIQCLNDLRRYISHYKPSNEDLERDFINPSIKAKELAINDILDDMFKSYNKEKK